MERIMYNVPFDKRDGIIWFNGEFIDWNDAKIHVLNHGLHYATSVFEGERSYNGKIFKSNMHSKRLIRSAELIGMKIPYNDIEIDNAKHELIKLQNTPNAYIRPIAWSGSEKMTIYAKENKINLALTCWDWPKFYEEREECGISLCISNWCRPDPRSAPTQSKASCNYTISSMSKLHASSLGYDDALMLDYRGYIAEATAANIFFVKDNILHTPIADCFLNGITRQTIIEIAKLNNIDVFERYIKQEELGGFDEVFVTGSAAEVTPIRQISDDLYNIGPLTLMLREEYHKLCLS